jgi:hypothetical protein
MKVIPLALGYSPKNMTTKSIRQLNKLVIDFGKSKLRECSVGIGSFCYSLLMIFSISAFCQSDSRIQINFHLPYIEG